LTLYIQKKLKPKIKAIIKIAK